MDALYTRLLPGGLLLATNVDPSNPIQHGMSFLLDWHLHYRTAADLLRLRPLAAPPDSISVIAEPCGLNLLLEIRKPAPDAPLPF
jgi:extracellular factor (EF) 3-hydroxypalmitic acid methyl ester biosynthesis protein